MRRLVASLILVVAAVWLLLCHYRFVENYRCGECLARRTDTSWWLGVMPLGYPVLHDSGSLHGPVSFVLSRTEGVVVPNSATTQLFPGSHAHTRVLAQASPYYLFGTRWGGCALGSSYQLSPFAYLYLEDAGFREYVARALEAGRFKREALIALYAAGHERPAPELFAQGIALANEYYRVHPNPSQEALFRRTFGAGA